MKKSPLVVVRFSAGALVLLTALLAGCLGTPDGVAPVSGFEISRYLGNWYEIARLDHTFERGLSNVTAEYALRDDGGISVLNRGYSIEKNEWKEAEGKAYFVGDKKIGHLKVSFFGPFYSSYVVFELDKDDYQYAFITGPDKSYLWLLARSPDVDQKMLKRFITDAEAAGFDIDKLIFVSQQQINEAPVEEK